MIDIKEIEKILPHRYPFLLVDRILELEPGKRAVGVKNVTFNEPYFQGHFPSDPIMPGVIIMEAMAQVGGILLMTSTGNEGKMALFGGADKVRFRRAVRPGDQLVTEVNMLKWKGNFGKVSAVGKVGEQVVAEAEYVFTLVEREEEDGSLRVHSVARRETQNRASIHPTAVIHPTAQVHETAKIGPFCVIGPYTKIGPNVELRSQVNIVGWTNIGADSLVFPGAVLGGTPQDRKFQGEESYLHIGERTQIREYVTIHRASGDGESTHIGDDNLLMAYSHIGHNCQVGNRVMLANNVGISGHVIINEDVNIGGFVGVHQYVRVGRLAMLGGYSKVVRDVPPFSLVDGRTARVVGLNTTGLKRSGIPAKTREGLKQALKLLYRSQLNTTQAIARIQEEIESTPELEYLLSFLAEVRHGYSGRARDPQGEGA